MKITNRIKNPTIPFVDVPVGTVFIVPEGKWGGKVGLKTRVFSHDEQAAVLLDGAYVCVRLAKDTQIVPVEAELILLKNTYDR